MSYVLIVNTCVIVVKQWELDLGEYEMEGLGSCPPTETWVAQPPAQREAQSHPPTRWALPLPLIRKMGAVMHMTGRWGQCGAC